MKLYAKSYVFCWSFADDRVDKFEKRTVVVVGEDIKSAEQEFNEDLLAYLNDYVTVLVEYNIQEFELADPVDPVFEITSDLRIAFDSIRGQRISADDYLANYLDESKLEDCELFQKVQHSWFTINENTKGCYNCNKVLSIQGDREKVD